MSQNEHDNRPKYTWPRYVLAAILAFVALAILWMAAEVARIKRIKKDTEDQKRSLVTPETRSK